MPRHFKRLKLEVFTTGRLLALVAAIFLGLGAFLTWGKTEFVTVDGLYGDGIITASIGVLTFLVLFVRRISIWIPFFIGLIGLIIGVVDFVAMYKITQNLSGQVGIGLYITIVSGVGIMTGAIVERFGKRERERFLSR